MSGTGYDVTVHYALKKPWVNADNDQWGVHQNQNMDSLDALLNSNLASGPFVPLRGAIMSGLLTLSQNPTGNFDAATKGYVDTAVTANLGVVSFNTRKGAVTLAAADVTGVGGALLASPPLSGTPTTPTAAPGTSTTQIASTAFVAAAVSASNPGVSSFNTRKGAVALAAADVTGVGGALLASPPLSGTPTTPTAAPGTSTTQIASTAFVAAAVSASNPGVSSFNARGGAVTLLAADVTGVGGALLASPPLSGTPTTPTAAPGTSTTQIASTAFVAAAVSGSVAGVASFNTRTGVVALQAADVTGVGGALLASPPLSGTPTAPTAAPGNNTTALATTAFVQAAAAAAASPALNNAGRNLIHNALLNVAQRGAGAFTVSGVYTMDRYYQGFIDGSLSTTRTALADSDRTQIGDEAAINCARFVVVGGSNAGSFTNWSQAIESVRRLAGKTVTVSFWAKCAAGTPKLGVSLDQAFGTPSGSAMVRNTGQAVTLTTTWARYSATLALPTAAGKTLGTNGDDSTNLNFWFSSGSTNNTFAGSVGVQSATFSLYGIQLEIGSAATSLEKLDPQTDLANCQRFFATGRTYTNIYQTAGGNTAQTTYLPVSMRATPTFSITANACINLTSPTLVGLNDHAGITGGTATATGALLVDLTYTASADL